MAGNAHVLIRQSLRQRRPVVLFSSRRRIRGGSGYGVFLLCRCTDNLIEDNIFYHLRHAATIEWADAGM
jgi:hypothetical protein